MTFHWRLSLFNKFHDYSRPEKQKPLSITFPGRGNPDKTIREKHFVIFIFKTALSIQAYIQARSQDRFGGVQDPPKVDLSDPKSGLFELTPNPPTKTPFLAHFVAKSGSFGRFGGCIAPPHPPGYRPAYNTASIKPDILQKFNFPAYPHSRGGHSLHDWLRTRAHKKRRFFNIRHCRHLLQKGYIFRC